MLLVAAVFGICNACIALLLDFAMHYGHILGKVRFNIIRRAAKRLGRVEEFDEWAESGRDIIFGERVEYFDKLYWEIATHSNRVVAWMCVKCLSYRIFIFTYILTCVGLEASILEAIVLFFVGSSANLLTIIVTDR